MVTIKMIAQRCGLSIAAVSRALNHQPGINAEKAEAIRRLAREMGYQPNTAARALKKKKSNTIGILYNNHMAHELFSLMLEGVRSETERSGYDLVFLNTRPGVTYYEHAMRQLCDGVIIGQGWFNDESVRALVESPLPVVTIEYAQPGCTVVISDNEAAMYEIVQHVHAMGHRRIGLIYGETTAVTAGRLAGFQRACNELGLSVPEEYRIQALYHHAEETAAATRKLLALPEPPTCIIFPDDISFLGGMAEIERQGLSIPRDISCVGFDGIQLTQYLRPALCTYRQDAEEMGRQAARELIAAIDHPEDYTARTVTVPGCLEKGGSVRNLR